MSPSIADPGALVLDLAAAARGQLLVIAPFVKVGALDRILATVSPGVEVTVVCRWHLMEVHAGVCDLEVWPLLRDSGAKLSLLPSLHAKVFASERSVLVGSANVTAAALGWSASPNFEALVRPCPEDEAATRLYASELVDRSSPVDDRVHAHFVELVGSLPPLQLMPEFEPAATEAAVVVERHWLPRSRDPEDVLRFYQADLRTLTDSAQHSAFADLQALQPPSGLDERQLRAHINAQLVLHPLVAELRNFLVTSRRFGEVAQFVGRWAGLGREDAAALWQTMIRWLVYFQPGEWELGKPRHSEILVYKGQMYDRPSSA